jgi:phenylpyruvate tautomerase PptA (4-oxalocrotonate tautomerase family)
MEQGESAMPNIIVRVPEGAFEAAAKQKLAADITAVAKDVEQIGDDPRQQFLTWLVIDEIPKGHLFAGGNDPTGQVIPVIVFFYPPAGVIDADGRARAVADIQKAVQGAVESSDPRPAMTSVIIADVPDGTWGANGSLWHLPDFARAAGYKHLQHLVSA